MRHDTVRQPSGTQPVGQPVKQQDELSSAELEFRALQRRPHEYSRWAEMVRREWEERRRLAEQQPKVPSARR